MRLRAALFACLALVAATVAAATAAGSPDARTAAGSAVQARGSEFRITLSRKSVKPGSVRVEFVNFGEDDHDLAIQRKGGGSIVRMSEIHPGERDVVTTRMKRGTYVFWCTLADHKARGMRAELKVRKPR